MNKVRPSLADVRQRRELDFGQLEPAASSPRVRR